MWKIIDHKYYEKKHIKMDKSQHKSPFSIDNTDINKIVRLSDKKDFKIFLGYKDDKEN